MSYYKLSGKEKRQGFIERKFRERCKKEVLKYSGIALLGGLIIGYYIGSNS